MGLLLRKRCPVTSTGGVRRGIVSAAVSESAPASSRARAVTEPPPTAVLPPRAAGAPRPGQPVPSHFAECFGCGPDHPRGMHMLMTAGEGLEVTATFVVTKEHQGAPGLAHGGVLVTALDDTLGALNWLLGVPAVTARLDTSFRRPVPVGAVLHLHAQITGVLGRKVYCGVAGRLNDPDGPVALSATAVFMQVPLEHFVRHGRPEDVARARRDEHVGDYLRHLEVNP